MEVLEQRLRGRGTETEEQCNRRLADAVQELEGIDSIDLWQVKIVNDDPSCHLEWPKTTDVILSRMVKDWSKTVECGPRQV